MSDDWVRGWASRVACIGTWARKCTDCEGDFRRLHCLVILPYFVCCVRDEARRARSAMSAR